MEYPRMTVEQAIYILQRAIKQGGTFGFVEDFQTAANVAIKALDRLAIERKAAIALHKDCAVELDRMRKALKLSIETHSGNPAQVERLIRYYIHWAIEQENETICNAVKMAEEDIPRPTPENKPLTLEQLRQMDGEPVYCINHRGDGRWALIHIYDDIQSSVCSDGFGGYWEFVYYGLTDDNNDLLDAAWLAYAHKPEEEK